MVPNQHDQVHVSSADPFHGLAEAISNVVRHAVHEALVEMGSKLPSDTATLVSVPEAAQRLGLGKTKVNELIACGALPSRIIGKRRLLRPVDLEAFAAIQDGADRPRPS
ncbi:MAG TPA: helix-turn-helix domain-containing protein [Chloroflexota bacterium]|nr:helix-turn-helix domain-containing protein [Chloroflexota bacterium]